MGLLDKFKKALTSSASLGLLDISKRFSLDRHSFTGTMSKFHVATDQETQKRFGLKLLDKEKTKFFRDRFKGLKKPSEAEIGQKIIHPNIVKTHEYGKTTTGQEYILMELMDGPGLNVVIKSRDTRIVPNRLKMIRTMAKTLQAVHDAGFIHRDVCPRNYICNKKLDDIKLIDFGLTVPDEEPYRAPGNRTGTPQYMAPEIVRRRATDTRVDVFAFGVTVYRFLTWEHPWATTDTSGMAALAHDSREPDAILKHRADLHLKLAKAVHDCLVINPEKRMSSCKRFLAAIRNVESETK